MELIYRDLAKYMAENIEDYEDRVQAALNSRSSLQHTDYNLYCQMVDLVADYIEDNELDILPEDIDIEYIMFNN